MKEIISKIVGRISDFDPGSNILVDNIAVPVSSLSFSIPSSDFSRIAFVDGGNAEVVGSANYSLQLAKLYYCIYDGKKKIKQQLDRFYILAIVDKDKVRVECFGRDLSFEIGLNDVSLRTGFYAVSPQRVAEHARKLAEFGLVSELSKEQFVVRDGDLDDSAVLESVFLKKSVNTVGLAKTNSLFTDSGASAVSVVQKHAPGGVWCCKLTDSISIVKLHSKSNYAFVLHSVVPEKVFSLLVQNSSDACFFGYPYGLILADKIARVRKDEVKTALLEFCSAGLKDCVDPHEILNRLS